MEPWWITLGTNFGVAAIILVAIGLGVYKGSKWVGSEILIPVRDRLMGRALGFIDNIEGAIQKLCNSVDSIQSVLEHHSETLLRIERLNNCGNYVGKPGESEICPLKPKNPTTPTKGSD